MLTVRASSSLKLVKIEADSALIDLLVSAGLPTADLWPQNLGHDDNKTNRGSAGHCELFTLAESDQLYTLELFDCESHGDTATVQLPVCCIGWEMYDSVALLRTLAVRSEWQGRGLGACLVSALERYAKAAQVENLYLLTETAERFFASRGYAVTERNAVPPAIASTAQFAGLCPDTATLMHKHLLP